MLPSIHLDEDALGRGLDSWQKRGVIALYEIMIIIAIRDSVRQIRSLEDRKTNDHINEMDVRGL